MSLPLWGLAFVTGATVYLALPIFQSLRGDDAALDAARSHLRRAQQLLGRSILLFRASGPRLVASEHDAGVGAEATKLDGQTLHFGDPQGKQGSLYGRPFGIADRRLGSFVDPLDVEVAEQVEQVAADDDWRYRDDRGQDWQRGWVSIPDRDRLVDVGAVTTIADGSADPGIADRVRSLLAISQDPYGASKWEDYLPLLIAFGAGFGVVYLASTVTSGGGGGGGGGIVLGWAAPMLGVLF